MLHIKVSNSQEILINSNPYEININPFFIKEKSIHKTYPHDRVELTILE